MIEVRIKGSMSPDERLECLEAIEDFSISYKERKGQWNGAAYIYPEIDIFVYRTMTGIVVAQRLEKKKKCEEKCEVGQAGEDAAHSILCQLDHPGYELKGR